MLRLGEQVGSGGSIEARIQGDIPAKAFLRPTSQLGESSGSASGHAHCPPGPLGAPREGGAAQRNEDGSGEEQQMHLPRGGAPPLL
jgi:hypothetical protein